MREDGERRSAAETATEAWLERDGDDEIHSAFAGHSTKRKADLYINKYIFKRSKQKRSCAESHRRCRGFPCGSINDLSTVDGPAITSRPFSSNMRRISTDLRARRTKHISSFIIVFVQYLKIERLFFKPVAHLRFKKKKVKSDGCELKQHLRPCSQCRVHSSCC